MQSPRKWWLGALASLAPAALAFFFVAGSIRGDRVPSFREQSDFFFPSHVYTAMRLRSLSLPLWNPLSGNGESWIGGGQNELFYPPAFLFLLRNPALATGIFLLVHFLLAYLFFLGFLRARGLSRPSSVLGSVVYAFSGCAVSLSAYWNHFSGFAWIPAMAWAAELGLTTRRQRAGFAFAFAATLLAGSPEMALFGAALSAIVYLFGWRREEAEQLETGRVRRRRGGFFGSAILAGAGLSAVQLFPIVDSLLRSSARSSVWPGQMTLRQLAGTFLTPAVSGVAWLPAGAGYLQSIYLSLPILLLPAAAFALAERRRERVLWAALAVLALAVSFVPFGAPFRFPAKVFAVCLFVLSLLAAEGLEGLRFAVAGRSRMFAGIFAVASSAIASLMLGRSALERETLGILGLSLMLTAWVRPPTRSGIFAAVAAAAAAGHLVCATLPLERSVDLAVLLERPLPPRGKVLTSEDEILANWANSALPDEARRVRRQIDSLSGYTNLLFGIAKARTAAALPTSSQQLFAQSLTGLDNFLPLAAVAGCGEVRFPRGEKMARVLTPSPLTGATFYFQDRIQPDSLAALKEISSGRADFRKVLALNAGPRLSNADDVPSGRSLALASQLPGSPERIEDSVSLSRDAWLYRPQSWDRWWEASIDGQPARIAKANGVFSAVLVPKGEHRIVWRYRPWPFFAGAGISALVLLVVLSRVVAGDRP